MMRLQQLIRWLIVQLSQLNIPTPAITKSEASTEYRLAQRSEFFALNTYTAYQTQLRNGLTPLKLSQLELKYQKQIANAKWYLLRAALRGHAEAQYKLGLCYLKGDLGLDRNYAQAERWLKKATQQGHHPAQQALCQAYAELAFS